MVNVHTGNKQVVAVLLNHIASFDTVCGAQIYHKLLFNQEQRHFNMFYLNVSYLV